MTDLDIEAIKGLDLSGFFNGLLREWYEGYQPCDGTLLVECLRNAGVNVDTLVAEVERLRTIEAAALDWDRADRGLEAMPCRDAAELLHRRRLAVHALRLALHPQEQTDAT